MSVIFDQRITQFGRVSLPNLEIVDNPEWR